MGVYVMGVLKNHNGCLCNVCNYYLNNYNGCLCNVGISCLVNSLISSISCFECLFNSPSIAFAITFSDKSSGNFFCLLKTSPNC